MFYLKLQKSLPYIAGAVICLLLTGAFVRVPFVAIVFAIGTIYLIVEAARAARTDPYDLRELEELEDREQIRRILEEGEDDHYYG